MHCKICKTSLQDQVSHPRRAPDSYPGLDAGLRGQESHTYWGDPEKQNLGWHLTWHDVPVSFPWKRTLSSRFLDRRSAIHQKKKAQGRFTLGCSSSSGPGPAAEKPSMQAQGCTWCSANRAVCPAPPGASKMPPQPLPWAWHPSVPTHAEPDCWIPSEQP